MDLYNYRQILERQLQLLRDEPEISADNKKIIFDFKDYLFSEGVGAAKISRYILDARKFCRMLNKPLQKASEADIRQVIGIIEQSELSAETKRCFKIFTRKLYRYMCGVPKGPLPPQVAWISINISQNNKKMPEELISQEEAKEMIRAADNTRDKAIISIFADSGARASEIGMLKIKHISFENHGARLTIHGKTGTRKILVIHCAPYLKNWINTHPGNNNPEAFLWPNSKGSMLSHRRLDKIVKQAAKKADIKKRIYLHLFRHSRATQLALIMTEAALNQYMGWVQGSSMAKRYIHMSGRDTDAAILQSSGIEVEKKPQKQLLKPIECVRCGTSNETTNRFCKVCSLPLNEEEAQMVLANDTKKIQVNEIMVRLLKNPEALQILAQLLQNQVPIKPEASL